MLKYTLSDEQMRWCESQALTRIVWEKRFAGQPSNVRMMNVKQQIMAEMSAGKLLDVGVILGPSHKEIGDLYHGIVVGVSRNGNLYIPNDYLSEKAWLCCEVVGRQVTLQGWVKLSQDSPQTGVRLSGEVLVRNYELKPIHEMLERLNVLKQSYSKLVN
jgi:hypothetical protein